MSKALVPVPAEVRVDSRGPVAQDQCPSEEGSKDGDTGGQATGGGRGWTMHLLAKDVQSPWREPGQDSSRAPPKLAPLTLALRVSGVQLRGTVSSTRSQPRGLGAVGPAPGATQSPLSPASALCPLLQKTSRTEVCRHRPCRALRRWHRHHRTGHVWTLVGRPGAALRPPGRLPGPHGADPG